MPIATQEPPAKEAPVTDGGMIVAPFGIEADHPRNCDLLIQSIPNCRLRSAIDGSKPVRDAKTGELKVPRDQAINMGDFPKTPGMQLHVDPQSCTYVIIDPLASNEQMRDRVAAWMKQHTAYRGGKIKVDDKLEGTLDKHRMKTLCREMFNLVKDGEAKHVRGPMPDMQDIEALPGNFLLNPGSRTQNMQPQFEKDFEAWVDRLAGQGG